MVYFKENYNFPRFQGLTFSSGVQLFTRGDPIACSHGNLQSMIFQGQSDPPVPHIWIHACPSYSLLVLSIPNFESTFPNTTKILVTPAECKITICLLFCHLDFF